MRTNNMKHFTISQYTSWNFDKKEITFEVHFADGIRHTYDKWKYDTFAEACTAYETLEARAKELEAQHDEAQRIAAKLEAVAEIPKEIMDFLEWMQAEIVPVKVGNGYIYEVRIMGFDDWKGSKQELIKTFTETMNEWKKEGLYK